SYDGRLQRVEGGQTLFGAYVFPTSIADAGAITLRFTDPTHGTLTWPGGSVPIERQPIGAGEAPFQPTGWWWNPAESGRGFSLEVQGDTMFLAGFMYNDSGQPVWYISSGKMSTPTHFVGTLQQIGGGQTIGGPYHFPTTFTNVGTVTIDFASFEQGTMTLSSAVAGQFFAKAGPVTIPIQPQLQKGGFTGSFTQTIRYNDILGTAVVTWTGADLVVVPMPTMDAKKFNYVAVSGDYKVTVSINNFLCTITGSISSKFQGDPKAFTYDRVNKSYVGTLRPSPVSPDTILLTPACSPVSPDPFPTPVSAFLSPLGIPLNGVANPDGTLKGTSHTDPNNSWEFTFTPR
ncbi:MAG: hypothetical protein ABI831_18895, partial [Betaproteobacteria bacterium]